jgi:hypothetical protein
MIAGRQSGVQKLNCSYLKVNGQIEAMKQELHLEDVNPD